MKKCILLQLLFTLLFTFAFVGCAKKDDNPSQPAPILKPQTADVGIIMGTVKGSDNTILDGVEISTNSDLKVQTNAQGYFTISSVQPNERVIVNFKKAGFVTNTKVIQVRSNESSHIDMILTKEDYSQVVSNQIGGTIQTPQGAQIIVPPGAFKNAAGQVHQGDVKIFVTVFDPTTEKGQAAFPGNFEGRRSDNSITPIQSFGFMDVTPRTTSGEPLQLIGDRPAEIVIPIPQSLQATAPNTIPMWHFDTQSGEWKEDGIGTKQGNVYRGQVTHFTVWNFDLPLSRAYIKGRVVDCTTNEPVKGAEVTARSLSASWKAGETSTPANGTFRFPVQAEITAEVWVSKNGVSSPKTQVTTPRRDQEIDIGDICLGTPKIRVALTWGAKPEDLDAHLTLPNGTSREHIYYSHKKSSAANLDTDDQNGFGPEITTVYKLEDGIYRFSVHHYRGEATISTSQAVLNLIIDGVGIYQLTPPAAGALGKNDVWLAWDIVVKDKKVESVKVLNSYKNDVTPTSTGVYSP